MENGMEIIILTDVKADRGRQVVYDAIYVSNLKNDRNEFTYKTDT